MDLGTLSVSFGVDLSKLTSGIDAGKAQISTIGSAVQGAAEQVSASADLMQEAMVGAAEGFAPLGEAAAGAGLEVEGGLLPGYEALDKLAEVSAETTDEVEGSLGAVNFDGFQSALNSLTEVVTGAVAEINEQIASIAEETEETESATSESAGGMGESFTGLISKVGLTIFGFQNMLSMGKQLAMGLLEPAMNAENMQESFTNLTGSAQAASDELAKLDTFAAKTQFTTMDIDQAGARTAWFWYQSLQCYPEYPGDWRQSLSRREGHAGRAG